MNEIKSLHTDALSICEERKQEDLAASRKKQEQTKSGNDDDQQGEHDGEHDCEYVLVANDEQLIEEE